MKIKKSSKSTIPNTNKKTIAEIKEKLTSAYVAMQLYGDLGRSIPRWFIKESALDIKQAVKLLNKLGGCE